MDATVELIFCSADELPPDERSDYLDEACEGQPELRQEVDALLAAAQSAETFFDEFCGRIGVVQDAAAPVPDQIGPYRVDRLIGEGGMGAVYLAERSDEQYEKQVAIKVLPNRFVGALARKRFLSERQILAQLVHPHICRLLDGGLTAEGVPYFVMDYVDGLSIDTYCDEALLPVKSRLELFCHVCAAVSFAHRNLIIHRDIKPGNVLVTAGGQAQLLDFGIAKIHDDEAEGNEHTVAGQRALTPLYAAPEMIRGEPVNTACDIYSLGVLLYFLLTGRYPRANDATSPQAIMLAVCEQPVARASQQVTQQLKTSPDEASQTGYMRSATAGQVATALRGDLDLILEKALAEEPEQRYPTVDALVDDIQAHLKHMPIAARAPSGWYRLRKLVQRRRALVSSVALSALLLVGAAGMATWFALSTAEQSRIIGQERDRAEKITNFLLGLFEQAHPNEARGEVVTAEELVDIGAANVRTELADQPESLADVLAAVASIYVVLGRYEQALPVLEDVVELRTQTNGELSEERASALDSLTELIEIQGDYERAESLQRQAVAVRRELGEPMGLANSTTRLGRVLHLKGDLEAAEGHYREGLGIYRQREGENSASVAQSLGHLGSLLLHQDRLEAAEQSHLNALAIWRSLHGVDHLKTVESHIQLAAVYNAQERFDEALSHSEIALNINIKLLGADHRDNMYITNGMGIALLRLGRYEPARARLHQTLDIMDKNLEAGHPNYAFVYANLGKLEVELADFQACAVEFARARDVFQNRLPDHWALYDVQARLGMCLSELGDFADAERELLRGYEGLAEQWGVEDSRTQLALEYLLDHFENSNQDEKADSYRSLLLARS